MQVNKSIFIISLIICSIGFPFLANNIWLSIITTFLIYSALSLSQDLILGKAGIYAMGHAMFFGIGAYTFAILINTYNVNLFIAFMASGIISYCIGLIIIYPIKHLRGDYFLVVSLGLNIIFINIINNDPFGLTGGPNGIFAINFPSVGGLDLTGAKAIYFIALIFLSVMILLFYRLNYSKFGRAIYYLNHDHIAAKSVGIKPSLNKLLSFSLGTMLAGFTGAIYTLQYGAVSPEAFGIEQSILLFAVVIVGGQGSLIGVVAGSFVMFVLPEIFRSYAEYRLLVFGAAMVILMVIRPNGLFPSKFGFFQKRHLQQK